MYCEACGLTYEAMRTGLDFATVRQMMYVGSENPEDWRSKSRHAVLGFWREMKLQLWHYHVGMCEQERGD